MVTVRPAIRQEILLLIVCLILSPVSCGTVEPAAAPLPPTARPFSPSQPIPRAEPNFNRSIRFEHLSLEQGLSQSVVNVIFQDSKGFLWTGTEDGLNRYDGYNFKVYRPEADNPNSISDGWVTSLAEDHSGFIWIGTRHGGLNRFDPRSGLFTVFKHDPSLSTTLSNNRIHALFVDEEGVLWAGTDADLDRFDSTRQEFTHYIGNQEGLPNPVTAIFRDSKKFLWIGVLGGGLNQLDEKLNSFKTYQAGEKPDSLSSNNITSIQEDLDGNLWVATENGLNRFKPATGAFARYMHNPKNPESLASEKINKLAVDHNGVLWIGTNNGLDVYDTRFDHFIHYRHEASNPSSLSNNRVFSVFEDRGGVMWVGTYGGGLNKYSRRQDEFAYYRGDPSNPQGLSGNGITSIYVEANDVVWIGTAENGLNRFNSFTGEFRQYHHDPANPDSLSSDQIHSILMDRHGLLWVGTSQAIDMLEPVSGKVTHFAPTGDESGLSASPVHAIHQDRAGNLWIGTANGLDYLDYKSQNFTHFTHDPRDPASLSDNHVTAIEEDLQGNLWVGTMDKGLNRITPREKSFTRYQNRPGDQNSLSNDSILSISQGRDGTIWVGTAGGGLSRYDFVKDTFTSFTEKDGLPNNWIYGILEDPENNLWLSTNYGLSRFNPYLKDFHNYTVSDGLQSNEFAFNAYAAGIKGEMYFGGINGLNSFDPLAITKDAYIPPIVLTSLTRNGDPISTEVRAEALQEISLQWPQNSFEFEFSALAYSQPSRNQYAYMLENFDSGWNNIGYKHSSRYTNLPGGAYTLLLKGSNSDGVWNETPLRIKVNVTPPFWQMNWFRILLGLLLASAIAGGYRLRLSTIQARTRELERLVQNRTADLEKRSREMEALYQADEKILRNVTLNQVFQTLVDVSVAMLNAEQSIILAWDEEEAHLIPRVSHGFGKNTLAVFKCSRGEGVIGRAAATGQTIIVTDLTSADFRPDVRAVLLEDGIKSFLHLPIKVDQKVIAVFNIGFSQSGAVNEDIVRLYTALVQRASLSIANMELFEQTKDLAVMEERNRLARDLHDSAKQKAFAALAQLGTANGMIKIKPEAVKPHLAEAETLVYEVIQELTFLIQEIYPIALQEKGLPTTLREYIFEWENRNDIAASTSIKNERPLPLETEQAIYRVIQEALANVARHSRARRVNISLVYNTDSLQVAISDDGAGFDVNQKAKGMGFRSMRERIGSIRGTFQVQSAPGQGTRVVVQIPVKG